LVVRNNDRGLLNILAYAYRALLWIASAISFSCLLLRSLAASNDRSNFLVARVTLDVVGYPLISGMCVHVYVDHPTK
ncbi:hypothetical protein EDC04DRAFT_2816938, partial [Pisolithus marmoratus]